MEDSLQPDRHAIAPDHGQVHLDSRALTLRSQFDGETGEWLLVVDGSYRDTHQRRIVQATGSWM
jgi:hypothetical protein